MRRTAVLMFRGSCTGTRRFRGSVGLPFLLRGRGRSGLLGNSGGLAVLCLALRDSGWVDVYGVRADFEDCAHYIERIE
jgi:hypothetical protein